MMKKIWNIARKDILIRFTSVSELLFFLVLPLLFTFLLSGGFEVGASESELPVLYVIDLDQTALSTEFTNALTESETMTIQMGSVEQAEAAVEAEEAAAALTIPAGFQEELAGGSAVQFAFDRSEESDTSEAVEQEVLAVLSSFNRAALAAQVSVGVRAQEGSHDSLELAGSYNQTFQKSLKAFIELPTGVKVTTPEGEETETGLTSFGAGHHNAGQLITWVFIPLLGTSVILTAERTEGTLRRLLTTPTGKSTFLLGTFVGQLLPAFFQYALLILFGIFVMGVDWGSSVAGLVLMLLAFSLASVAFGAMVGTLTKSSGQANNLSIMAGMAMALLGGCWWPSELFPESLRVANKILPTSWAIQGLSDLSLRGMGFVEILPEAGVLFGFAAVFFIVGILRFRFE